MLGSNPGLLLLRQWSSDTVTTRIDFVLSSARSHLTQLDLILLGYLTSYSNLATSHTDTRLNLTLYSARSHPTRLGLILLSCISSYSATSHPNPASHPTQLDLILSHPNSATSHPTRLDHILLGYILSLLD
jgi:hypothetical protein